MVENDQISQKKKKTSQRGLKENQGKYGVPQVQAKGVQHNQCTYIHKTMGPVQWRGGEGEGKKEETELVLCTDATRWGLSKFILVGRL